MRKPALARIDDIEVVDMFPDSKGVVAQWRKKGEVLSHNSRVALTMDDFGHISPAFPAYRVMRSIDRAVPVSSQWNRLCCMVLAGEDRI